MKKAPRGKLFFVHDISWKHGTTQKFIKHQILSRKDALDLEAAHELIRANSREIENTGGWKASNREALALEIHSAKAQINQLTQVNKDIPIREHPVSNPHKSVALKTAQGELP